jgi:acyl-coenzyme A synthetase/AMP-(fatty) acid ligase
MSAPAVTNTTWPYRTIPDIDAYLTSANQAWATERRIINGRPLKVFINQHASLRDFFEVSMAAGGDKEYIIDQGVDGKLKRTTYNKASLEVDRIANLLRSYGCVKGDRIAIISRNTREWITTFWAIACIGGIASAVNAFSTPEVLAFCLTLTTSKVVVIDQERAFMLAPFVDRLHAAGCSQILVVNGKGATKGMKDFAEELRNGALIIFLDTASTDPFVPSHSSSRSFRTNQN